MTEKELEKAVEEKTATNGVKNSIEESLELPHCGENIQPEKDSSEGPGHPLCPKKQCDFSHDVSQYLSTKIPDIGEDCHNFKTFGRCEYGLACR